MSDAIQVRVTANDMEVQDGKAIINSNELVNALIVEPASAWQLIATSYGLTISTDNVRVREDGRIIISDREFANKVQHVIEESAKEGRASSNCSCTNYYCA